MTPERLEELAQAADPNELWRIPTFPRDTLTEEERRQRDTAVALRRAAHHLQRLEEVRTMGRSLLITPLRWAENIATKTVDTPPDHARLRHPERENRDGAQGLDGQPMNDDELNRRELTGDDALRFAREAGMEEASHRSLFYAGVGDLIRFARLVRAGWTPPSKAGVKEVGHG